MVFNPGLRYEQECGYGIHLGGHVEYFYNPELIAYEDRTPVQTTNSTNWSMGIYLRINPSITLKNLTKNGN
jgi:hypothetical protein